jgi:hypothetical protein
MERTRARRAAWTQRELPFEREARMASRGQSTKRKLSEQEVAHRRQMLEHLVEAARRGA